MITGGDVRFLLAGTCETCATAPYTWQQKIGKMF